MVVGALFLALTLVQCLLSSILFDVVVPLAVYPPTQTGCSAGFQGVTGHVGHVSVPGNGQNGLRQARTAPAPEAQAPAPWRRPGPEAAGGPHGPDLRRTFEFDGDLHQTVLCTVALLCGLPPSVRDAVVLEVQDRVDGRSRHVVCATSSAENGMMRSNMKVTISATIVVPAWNPMLYELISESSA